MASASGFPDGRLTGRAQPKALLLAFLAIVVALSLTTPAFPRLADSALAATRASGQSHLAYAPYAVRGLPRERPPATETHPPSPTKPPTEVPPTPTEEPTEPVLPVDKREVKPGDIIADTFRARSPIHRAEDIDADGVLDVEAEVVNSDGAVSAQRVAYSGESSNGEGYMSAEGDNESELSDEREADLPLVPLTFHGFSNLHLERGSDGFFPETSIFHLPNNLSRLTYDFNVEVSGLHIGGLYLGFRSPDITMNKLSVRINQETNEHTFSVVRSHYDFEVHQFIGQIERTHPHIRVSVESVNEGVRNRVHLFNLDGDEEPIIFPDGNDFVDLQGEVPSGRYEPDIEFGSSSELILHSFSAQVGYEAGGEKRPEFLVGGGLSEVGESHISLSSDSRFRYTNCNHLIDVRRDADMVIIPHYWQAETLLEPGRVGVIYDRGRGNREYYIKTGLFQWGHDYFAPEFHFENNHDRARTQSDTEALIEYASEMGAPGYVLHPIDSGGHIKVNYEPKDGRRTVTPTQHIVNLLEEYGERFPNGIALAQPPEIVMGTPAWTTFENTVSSLASSVGEPLTVMAHMDSSSGNLIEALEEALSIESKGARLQFNEVGRSSSSMSVVDQVAGVIALGRSEDLGFFIDEESDGTGAVFYIDADTDIRYGTEYDAVHTLIGNKQDIATYLVIHHYEALKRWRQRGGSEWEEFALRNPGITSVMEGYEG